MTQNRACDYTARLGIDEIQREDGSPAGTIQMIGVDEVASIPMAGSRLFDVHFILSEAPPEAWVRIFVELWSAAGTCPARIIGRVLVASAAPEDIERDHHYTLKRILLQTNEAHCRQLELAAREKSAQAQYAHENYHRIRGLSGRLGY